MLNYSSLFLSVWDTTLSNSLNYFQKFLAKDTSSIMKNVLFIIDSLVCGGAEKSLVSLLPLLNSDKYNIFLWMRREVGEFITLLPSNVHIIKSPSYSFLEKAKLRIGGILYSLKIRTNSIFGIKEHLAETLYKCQGWAMKVPQGNWNVVVAYQQGLPTYLLADKFLDCKKIAWINADIFKAGYSIDFNSRFYRKINNIVLVSELLHTMLKERIPEFTDKYSTVRDIINPEITKRLANEPSILLRSNAGEFVFVTTGRLVVPKGYDIALDAAKELKNLGVSFKWYFIGEGPERKNIEDTILKYHLEENIQLLGVQLNPYKYMAKADIYVQTSRFEGFGMTIGEAKILGKPIVSTDFDVVYNQITNGKDGLIVKQNGKSVAEAILRLINNYKLRQDLISELAREENITSKTEIKKVESLLDN